MCVQYDVMRLRGTDTNPRILLCVDELMQCADKEADCRALVHRLGCCMDHLQRGSEDGRGMVVVVSAPDRETLLDPTSNRPIFGVPLPALDYDDALMAFANFISRTTNTTATPEALAAKPWHQSLVAMASGHPRTLTYLAQATRDYHGNLDGEATQFVIETARRAFMDATAQRPIPEKDTLQVVEAIVSGRAMKLDEKLGARTVKELIANGTLINSGYDLNYGWWFCDLVPTMSVLYLSALAERCDAVPDYVSKRLSHFLRMFRDTALAGKGFERLDARFRALQRAVRHATTPGARVPMATMAEHGIIRSPRCSWWEEVEVGFAKGVDVKTQGKRQFSFDFGNLVTMEAPHDTVEQRPGLAIFPSASNNPGCDVVFIDEEHNGDDGTGNVVTMFGYMYADPRKGLSDVEGMLTTKLRVLTNHGPYTRGWGMWSGDGCVILTCKDMLTHS